MSSHLGAIESAAPRWLPLALVAAAAYVVGTTLAAMLARWDPLPFWDQWDFVADVAARRGASWTWAELWAPHNEHRLFFPRLLFLADFAFAEGCNRWLLVATLLLLIVQTAGLARLAAAGLPRRGLAGRVGVTAMAALFVFSAIPFTNLVWGFQVQFALVGAAAVVAVLGVVSRQHARTRCRRLVHGGVVVVAAAVATGSMANGMAVWAVAVVLAVWLRAPAAFIGLLGVSGAVAAVAYWGGFVAPERTAAVNAGGAHGGPVHTIGLFVCCLGSIGRTWKDLGVCGALGVLGLAWFGWLTVSVRRCRLELAAEDKGLFALAAFALATVAMIAVGRRHLPVEAATAERYATVSLWFWGALTLLASRRVLRPPPIPADSPAANESARRRARAAVAATAVIAVVVAQQHRGPLKAMPVPGHQRQAALALLVGIQDEQALRQTHPDPELVARCAQFLRERRCSVFATPSARWLGATIDPDRIKSWPLVALREAPLGGGRCVSFESPDVGGQILLVDAQNVVVGLAERVHDQSVEFTGYARIAAGEDLRALAMSAVESLIALERR